MVNNDRLLVQILLLALLGAGLWVMAPFISALLWGAILAFASWPLMRLLTRVLGARDPGGQPADHGLDPDRGATAGVAGFQPGRPHP